VTAVAGVVFQVDCRHVTLSEPEGRMLGERLRGFAAGNFPADVALLAKHGTDPEWVEGARALADAIEDVLTTTREGPIPIDAKGKAANAALAALALSLPVSYDATSGLSRLYNAIRDAR
jgi:hypothetical protein